MYPSIAHRFNKAGPSRERVEMRQVRAAALVGAVRPARFDLHALSSHCAWNAARCAVVCQVGPSAKRITTRQYARLVGPAIGLRREGLRHTDCRHWFSNVACFKP
jgi:hypothetical protein